MKFSAQEEYGLRCLLQLGMQGQGGSLTISELSHREGISVPNVAKMMRVMRRAGFVCSTRGKDGGYWLALSPVDITYGDLIRVMRGSLALVPCASRFAHEKCKNCLEEGECRTRALMLQVRDRTAELLDSIRLSDPIALVPAQEDYEEAELGTGHG